MDEIIFSLFYIQNCHEEERGHFLESMSPRQTTLRLSNAVGQFLFIFVICLRLKLGEA